MATEREKKDPNIKPEHEGQVPSKMDPEGSEELGDEETPGESTGGAEDVTSEE